MFSGHQTCGKWTTSNYRITTTPAPSGLEQEARPRPVRGEGRPPGCGARRGPLPSARRLRPPSLGPAPPLPGGAVPAGSPAPCQAAGGPAASWGSWSAAATQCPGICHYSSSAAGYWPRSPAVPKASLSSLATLGDREGGAAPTDSGPRPDPLRPARECTAPNAWRATPPASP